MIKEIVTNALWLHINGCPDLHDSKRAKELLLQLDKANTAVERFVKGVYTKDDWLDTIADINSCDVDDYINNCDDTLLHLGF